MKSNKVFNDLIAGEGRKKVNMSGNIIFTVIILLAAAVVTVLAIFKGRPKVKSGGTKRAPGYSENDKDMMELIHELSVIYENTDRYLGK